MSTDDHRVDLFLSFHGGETLRGGFTTRDVARQANILLKEIGNDHGAEPNVFFDENGVHEHITTDIFTAILQLRGGGLGVCLLTPTYFRRAWCLSECRALLEVQRQDPSVRLRFLCIECTAGELLRDNDVSTLEPRLKGFSLLSNIDTSSCGAAALSMAEFVWEVWNGKDGMPTKAQLTILGMDSDISLHYLAHFFLEDAEQLSNFWDVSADGGVHRIFDQARRRRIIGPKDVESLLRFAKTEIIRNRGTKIGAINAHKRKWIGSRRFMWGDTAVQELSEIHEKAVADISSLDEMPTAAPQARMYVVKPGDTLWKIALELYGNPSLYQLIFQANKHIITDPDVIYPGMELTIPEVPRSTFE